MRQSLAALFGLVFAGCAAASPRFTVSPVSPGWKQIIAIGADPAVRQPLLKLQHKVSGAEVTVDVYETAPGDNLPGGVIVTWMAVKIRDQMAQAGVTAEPLVNESGVCSVLDAGDPDKRVFTARFNTLHVNERGELRRGKVTVRQVPGAPSNRIFVFAGHWPMEIDDDRVVKEFNCIVYGAVVR